MYCGVVVGSVVVEVEDYYVCVLEEFVYMVGCVGCV